jgi:hypothetical protein
MSETQQKPRKLEWLPYLLKTVGEENEVPVRDQHPSLLLVSDWVQRGILDRPAATKVLEDITTKAIDGSEHKYRTRELFEGVTKFILRQIKD